MNNPKKFREKFSCATAGPVHQRRETKPTKDGNEWAPKEWNYFCHLYANQCSDLHPNHYGTGGRGHHWHTVPNQHSISKFFIFLAIALVFATTLLHYFSAPASADGAIFPPLSYKGSLEEKAQEAIIVFQRGIKGTTAKQDLVLKIKVKGDVKSFGWVVPFPNTPEIAEEDPKLFEELFRYVEYRKRRKYSTKFKAAKSAEGNSPVDSRGVEVISRKIVGKYDTVVIRETEEGGLNRWLKDNDFPELDQANDVLSFYRNKNYVFACMKVNAEELAATKAADLHPLRFTFETGGRDGIFFPMKMSGLLNAPFDVNLYIFYEKWLNDKVSKFGYNHRGFRLNWRDYDSKQCTPNAGKSWSAPNTDPYLKSTSHIYPTMTKYFQKRHPGERFYLTNIKSYQIKPNDVRNWSDDLWLFPHYTDSKVVPYDVLNNGPASTAWPNEKEAPSKMVKHPAISSDQSGRSTSGFIKIGALVIIGISLLLLVGFTLSSGRFRKA